MKFTFIVQFGACYVRMPFLKSISGQNWFYLFANQRIQERTKISSLKFQYVLCYATMNTTQHNTQKKNEEKNPLLSNCHRISFPSAPYAVLNLQSHWSHLNDVINKLGLRAIDT